MMKYHILALFIAVVAILQPVSCDEQRITRTVQAIKIKKEKKSSKKEKKSSKETKSSKEMKSSKEKNEITSSVDADNFSRACTTHDECKGHYGNSESAGCWLGKCQMCLPSSYYYSKFRGGKCMCAKNGGGNDNFDVSVDGDGWVGGVSSWPPFGGQFRDRCNECRRRMEADGVIMPGSSCSRFIDNSMFLSPLNMDPLWKDFGPPNISHTIGRYPADCIPNSGGGEGCKLRCGIHNGSQMHINYNPTYGSKSMYTKESEWVWGLPIVLGDWRNGCLVCGSYLEAYGFIESGWVCVRDITGIALDNFQFRMQ